MAAINYAAEYAQALAQAYPNVLHFGALYATENNGRYRMGENGKSVYIPRIKTSGRVDSNRDSLVQAKRNFDNSWELKPLTHQRQWNTLVHPMDIQQTNDVASIQNITQVFNETQKFPEMAAYLISQLYKLWTSLPRPMFSPSSTTSWRRWTKLSFRQPVVSCTSPPPLTSS